MFAKVYTRSILFLSVNHLYGIVKYSAMFCNYQSRTMAFSFDEAILYLQTPSEMDPNSVELIRLPIKQQSCY